MRIKDLAQGMLWPMRVHPRLHAKPSPAPIHHLTHGIDAHRVEHPKDQDHEVDYPPRGLTTASELEMRRISGGPESSPNKWILWQDDDERKRRDEPP